MCGARGVMGGYHVHVSFGFWCCKVMFKCSNRSVIYSVCCVYLSLPYMCLPLCLICAYHVMLRHCWGTVCCREWPPVGECSCECGCGPNKRSWGRGTQDDIRILPLWCSFHSLPPWRSPQYKQRGDVTGYFWHALTLLNDNKHKTKYNWELYYQYY